MLDIDRRDRDTVRVIYDVHADSKRRNEMRIYANLKAAPVADQIARLKTLLRREHPGCVVRIKLLDRVLTEAR
jgi:hypothetical protein